jgi:tetratricopeptide (TPR) repeat protein
MLRMKQRILPTLLLTLAAGPVSAQLTTAIADDGTDRIVLKSGFDEFDQHVYVKTLIRDQNERVGPLLENAPCATLGSQMIERARSTQFNLETLVARYNLVNLWLGNLCHGKSDVLPAPEEAKAWLLGIVRATLPGDAHRSLRTHGMLVQLYLFGAPGSPPDYPAALALLNEDVRGKDYFPALTLSYVYEHGLGAPKDPVQARAWLEQAAEHGIPDARVLLAQAKERDNAVEAFNVYLDVSKAVEPPVWFRLGLMYLEGRGTQKDPCKAQDMLQKAAGHVWTPVPQARKYLDQIREQNLCPQTALKRSEPAATARPAEVGLESSEPAPCLVKIPADTGELHPKRIDRSRKTIYDKAEYSAYMDALKQSDPQRKSTALEAFVTRYPQSIVKANALEQALTAYKASGNTAKLGETANRLLEAQPDNLWALNVIVSMARDCASRGAIVDTKAAGKQLLQLGQRALAAMPEFQETQGVSQADAGKLRATFAGAAGWGALQNDDYGAARQFYEMAVAGNPNYVMNFYELARADLAMTPIDPNGFWYCGKAVSIAQVQYKAGVGMMSFFCKVEFQKHGGKLEEWDGVVSNTEKDAAPPPDFAKSLSLQEPSQTP